MAEDGFVPIGELARRTGVATSALRYYERIGLLSPAERAGGRRHYTASSAERVHSFASTKTPASPSRKSAGCSPPGFRDVEAGVIWPSARSRSSTLASRTRSEQRSSSPTLSIAHTAISSPAPASGSHSRLNSNAPVTGSSSQTLCLARARALTGPWRPSPSRHARAGARRPAGPAGDVHVRAWRFEGRVVAQRPP